MKILYNYYKSIFRLNIWNREKRGIKLNNKIIKNGEIWESNLEFWVGAIPIPTQPSAPTKSLREWRVFKPLPPPLNSSAILAYKIKWIRTSFLLLISTCWEFLRGSVLHAYPGFIVVVSRIDALSLDFFILVQTSW